MYLAAVASVAAGTRSPSSSSKLKPEKSSRPNMRVSALDHNRADAVVRVQQEEAFLHRFENVPRLFLRFARQALASAARSAANKRAAAAKINAASTPTESNSRSGLASADACVCNFDATLASKVCNRLVFSLAKSCARASPSP